MKKTTLVVLVVLVIGALFLAACGGGGNEGSGKQRQSPPSDIGANPMEGNAEAVTAGQQLFATNCATCHGEQAKGDGPAGAALDPKPANLEQTAKETQPQYQYWVIAKGGAAAGLSASMPAFEGVLTPDQIWQVVTYLDTTYGK